MDKIISNNPFPDYSQDISSIWISDDTLVEPLKKEINTMIDNIYCKLEELCEIYDSKSNYTIYNGYCGTALVSYYLYKKYKIPKYLDVAKNLVNLALDNLKGECISFLNGDAGPIALGIVINSIDNNIQKCKQLIKQLINLGNVKKQNPFIVIENDVLNGRAGYLYSLIFVDQNLDEPVIPEMVLRKNVEEILHSGFKASRKERSPVPLEFECYDRKFLGAANGIAGTLYILLVANRYMTDYELECIVRPTLNALFALKYENSNFGIDPTDKENELIQWCHGATGFVHLAALASVVYSCHSYYKISISLSKLIWKQGLLNKGYSICHGVAGNAYIFLYFYKLTNAPLFLYKAACFADYCLRYPDNEGMVSDWPYSLFQGIAGILLFLLDIQDPRNSYFPGYELDISE